MTSAPGFWACVSLTFQIVGAPHPVSALVFAALNDFVEGSTGDARVGDFSVADGAGFVDFLTADADLVGRRDIVPVRNNYGLADRGDLAALLRRVIFVSQAPLSEALDFQCISLCAIDCGDDLIVGVLSFRNATSWLGPPPRATVASRRVFKRRPEYCSSMAATSNRRESPSP